MNDEIAAELARARQRTLALVDDLDEADQRAQHSALMSPLVWDLAHVGNYEELWLLRELDGRPATDPALDDLYNAFEHPRWERPSLPILGPSDARAYDAAVREQVLELLHDVDTGSPPAGPHDRRARLCHQGAVYGMVLQHEHQHDETMLATRQLMGERAPAVPGARPAPSSSVAVADDTEVVLDLGTVVLGSDDDPWAYDNERGAHEVDLAPFALDRTPVTNRRWLTFLDDGGYDDERLWSEAGWAWRIQEGLRAPLFWRAEGDGAWSVLRFGRRLDVAHLLDEPVQHVCWYEADAFARWAGRRLPTEAEWEAAATWDPATGTKRRHPWGDDPPAEGHANLGQRHDGPSAVGAHPLGTSPTGVLGLIGDVWEWTSSDFEPYPGFDAFPYREYSEVFWGDGYKVLRGGSWAADHLAVRGTFRNWDHPIRRQIFCGLRTARDA
ncbi:MAG: ergothioneine biosynthesis protein EgtB [Acidimicrobiales bacterium]